MIVVDASVWVGSLLENESDHPRAREWVGSVMVRRDPLAVPTLVFAEVAGAIARRQDDHVAGDEAVSYLLRAANLQVVTVDRDIGILSARIAADLRLRGADAVYVAVTHALDASLATLDRELQRRAGQFVPIILP